jgi:hypothetical protein
MNLFFAYWKYWKKVISSFYLVVFFKEYALNLSKKWFLNSFLENSESTMEKLLSSNCSQGPNEHLEKKIRTPALTPSHIIDLKNTHLSKKLKSVKCYILIKSLYFFKIIFFYDAYVCNVYAHENLWNSEHVYIFYVYQRSKT